MQVPQSQVTTCPSDLEPGYYGYGQKHSSSGNPPHWVDAIFAKDSMNSDSMVQATPPTSSSDTVAGTRAPQGATKYHHAEYSAKDKPSLEN